MKSKLQKKELAAAVKKPSHKRELAVVEKKQTNKRVLTTTEKKPPEKKKLTTIEKKPPKKKEISAADKTLPQKKETPVVVKEYPQKIELAIVEKKQPKKEEIPVVDLGTRYKCFKCGTKFYDLGRPEPLCPSCGVNQNDDEAKMLHKRKRKRRSFYTAKEEPVIFAPEERDDVIEVVSEVDTEYTLDADDIVLEEHGDTDNE